MEKTIEMRLRDAVKKLGGLALKFWPLSFTGFPDRMVLMPGGLIWFVEMKDTGKKVKVKGRQNFVIRMLIRMGFNVRVVNNEETLKTFLDEIRPA